MTARKNILIVDDDEDIISLLPAYLLPYGYTAHVAVDGAGMQQQLAQHTIDLIVLDIMLPGPDGLSLARDVRRNSHLPIIMLTARGTPYDRVLGLENGADDYITKPFEPRELVARIQSVLRRAVLPHQSSTMQTRSDVVRFDGWELHRENHCLHTPDGLVVALSNAEFRLLCTILQGPRRPFKREQLVESTDRLAMDVDARSIDLLVSRLRQKLARAPNGQHLIKTVRGSGYAFTASVTSHAE